MHLKTLTGRRGLSFTVMGETAQLSDCYNQSLPIRLTHSQIGQCCLLVSVITGKFSVMIVTPLYVIGSCERRSELTEEMYIPLVHVNVVPSLQKRCTSLWFM